MVLRPSLGIAFLCNCRQFSTLGSSGALPAPPWIPRGLRDGPGVTFGVPKTSTFGRDLGPAGAYSDFNDLDCVKNGTGTSVVSKTNTIALRKTTEVRNFKLDLKRSRSGGGHGVEIRLPFLPGP